MPIIRLLQVIVKVHIQRSAKITDIYAYCHPTKAFIETLVAAGEGMIASKSGELGNHRKAETKYIIDKVVAIPFPVGPRQVRYGPLAKVFDFLGLEKLP